MMIDGIGLLAIISGAFVLLAHSIVTGNKSKTPRCMMCDKEDLFPMLLFKGKTLRLCKDCYDEEIDQELTVCAVSRA